MAEFARLSRFEVDPDRADEAIRFFGETDLERVSGAEGFRTAFWLLDRDTGKGVEMVVFESREALEAAEAEEQETRSGASEVGASMGSDEIYEVIAEVAEEPSVARAENARRAQTTN